MVVLLERIRIFSILAIINHNILVNAVLNATLAPSDD